MTNHPPAVYVRRKDLTPAQLRWCAANLKAFTWPGAQRAAAAYERAQGTEARNSVRETV